MGALENSIDSTSEDSDGGERILIKEPKKSFPLSKKESSKSLSQSPQHLDQEQSSDKESEKMFGDRLGEMSLTNGGGNAAHSIQRIGQMNFFGSIGKQSTGYRKKNPLFYNESKKKARSTTHQKMKSMLSNLRFSFRQKFQTSSPRVDETLQYRVDLARQLNDDAPDEEVQLRHLLKILQSSEEKQRNSLRPARRHTKEIERLEKERKEREKRIRGILGRQPLPEEMEDEQEQFVQQTMYKSGKIASIPGAEVASHDIRKLSPAQWLNDEVINFYLKLIERRSNLAVQKRAEGEKARERVRLNNYDGDEEARKNDLNIIAEVKKKWNGISNVHVFTTFFFEKLSKQGYSSVRQWTRKVDIFTKDIVLIPINIGQMHWVCAAINMRQLRFEYYDSMHASNERVFDLLADYLEKEYADKKKLEFGTLNVDGWKRYFSKQSPIQANGFDCGVFACMTIEQLSRRNPWDAFPPPLDVKQVVEKSAELASTQNLEEEEEDWNFSQKNMPYLRKRMVYEIATTGLLDD